MPTSEPIIDEDLGFYMLKIVTVIALLCSILSTYVLGSIISAPINKEFSIIKEERQPK